MSERVAYIGWEVRVLAGYFIYFWEADEMDCGLIELEGGAENKRESCKKKKRGKGIIQKGERMENSSLSRATI